MSIKEMIIIAYAAGYQDALNDVQRELEREPFFLDVERDVAIESVKIKRNTERINALAAGFFYDAAEQMEVR